MPQFQPQLDHNTLHPAAVGEVTTATSATKITLFCVIPTMTCQDVFLDIYAIYSGSLSDAYACAFSMTFFLAFYLAYFLASYLTYVLTAWRSFSHSSWHSV